MGLPEVVEAVSPSVVALGCRIAASAVGKEPLFPTVLGTGFVVDARGIAVTNEHVARQLENLPAGMAIAVFFPPPQDVNGEFLQGVLFRKIRKFSFLGSFHPREPYYGPEKPDFAFLQIDVRDAPSVTLNREPGVIRTGIEVAAAGFPLGSQPLTVFGKVSQLSATVRRGIVSSVHPSPGPFPDGFTTDMALQQGSSGSPVFLADSGTVIGIVHSVLPGAPNMAFALPSNLLALGLEVSIEKGGLDLSGVPTWSSLLEESGAKSLDWQRMPNPTST